MTPAAHLPGIDIRFLQNVVQRLAERRLQVYHPGRRRSAVALILKFGAREQRTLMSIASSITVGGGSALEKGGVGPEELLHRCEASMDTDAPSSLRLLLLKRADLTANRWSGQVTFPGGYRDEEDADDLATVRRAVYDQIGIPLHQRKDFILLGQLPDYPLRSRVLRPSPDGVVQARYVFLHVGALTPSTHIATHEVDSVRWVPLRVFAAGQVQQDSIWHPITSFVRPQDADLRLLLGELFTGAYLTFPSVIVPSGDDTDGSAPLSEGLSWRVWGLSLRSANELLLLDNRASEDWPLVNSNSRLLRLCLIYPWHGFYELQYLVYRIRAYLLYRLGFMGRWRGGSSGAPEGPAASTGSSSFFRSSTLPEARRRLYLYGDVAQRRLSILPITANPLLLATPEQLTPAYAAAFVGIAAAALLLCYLLASVIGGLSAVLRLAVGEEGQSARTEQRRAYCRANGLSSTVSGNADLDGSWRGKRSTAEVEPGAAAVAQRGTGGGVEEQAVYASEAAIAAAALEVAAAAPCSIPALHDMPKPPGDQAMGAALVVAPGAPAAAVTPVYQGEADEKREATLQEIMQRYKE